MLNSPRSKRLVVICLDLAAVLASFAAAFLLRFEFEVDSQMVDIFVRTVVYVGGIHLISAHAFNLYRGIYHFSSFADLINITKAVAAGGTLSALAILFFRQGGFPRSILILHPVLTFLGICGIRFGIRLVKNYLASRKLSLLDARNVVLIGAGELGESIVRQMLKTPEARYNVVGFIDDDPSKWGMRIHGFPVLGGKQALPEVIERHRVEDVVIAIARRRGEIVSSVMEIIGKLDPRPELKIAPALNEMLQSPSRSQALRKVRPADLLNRDVIQLDEPKIARLFERKVILVTGAGGTIGSELCRQVVRYAPEKIVILESHATSLFYAEARLKELSRGTAVVPILGDIRDQALVDRVFKAHRPSVVLHAAAHKHVHQLEFNVHEGVTNNVLGTHYLASAADKNGTEAFLLVSTDKAVRPSSVMGATKRAAERVIQQWARRSRTRYCAVRFGNVLGSSGSVLPIFEEQIAKGGPVTVTDARVTRYFMTVEEAVGLILQAVSMAQGGEVFVLKMGTPVKIIEMARNLILLSGLDPEKDIEIKITGLKQGEKLDEELAEESSEVGQSSHPDISMLTVADEPSGGLDELMLEIEVLCRGQDASALLKKLCDFVPTFSPAQAHLDRTT